MGILGIVLLVIFVIVSLLLIFLVIIQDEGSESLGGIFAGGSSSAFGSRSSNVVIRVTYVLGGLFFVTAFGLALVNKGSIGDVEKAALENKAKGASTEWWTSQPQTQAPAELAPAGAQVETPAEPVPAPASK
ncbi:MAG: preprotein translocase subunit SecG [Spirochaetaceae bacterium]|nr:preprotein translocase subunit SecG [Spirochaetaceae bacterium]